MTSITSYTGTTSWTTRLARVGRQARSFSVPLVVAGVLAAGCGTTHATGSASAGTAASTTPSAAASAAQSAAAAPVPTVTGGSVVAGEPACSGWPSGAPHGTLTALFGAVAVERCVTGYQKGPGDAEWQTATLEKATKNITPLVDALLQPSTQRRPDTVCPDLVMIPPQVLLISSTGEQLIPRVPLTGCGIVDSRILTALEMLTWQPVSVRLIAKVSGMQPGTATVEPRSPKTFQTMPSAGAASLS
jgi:hypothetical protein